MDILKQGILKKIKSQNLNFTIGEKEIIKKDEILFFELIKKCLQFGSSGQFDKMGIMYEMEPIDYDNFTVDIRDKIKKYKEKNKNVIAKYNIYIGKLFNTNLDLLEQRNFFLKKLSDPNYKIHEVIIDEDLINILLDAKRYDIIKGLSFKGVTFSENTIIKIIEEFPFYKYDFNFEDILYNISEKLLKKIMDEYLSKLSIGFLIRQFKMTNLKMYKDVLLKKIKDSNCSMEVCTNTSLSNEFTEEEMKIIINKAIENKQLSLILNSNFELNDEITKILEIIKNDYEIPNEIITNTTLLNNESFLSLLIEKGYIPLLYRSNAIINDKLKDRIVELINKNPHFLKKINTKVYYSINTDVIIALLNKNCFNILNQCLNMSEIPIEYIIKKFKEISINDISNKEDISSFCALIVGFILNDNDMINYFLEPKEFEKVLYLFFKYTYYLPKFIFEEYENEIIESIKVSQYAYFKIYESEKEKIITNKNLRSNYIKINQQIINEILDYIYLHEDLMYLYDDDLFDEVKTYFINKYNLDAGHLEVLKNKFGPSITRYLNNEQIQKIINLDYSKFIKFINLFPHKKYEMKDLETIYDSFKQEEFSKKYPEIKNIFARITHSLQVNDKKYVESILELETVWSESLVKKIIEKYPDQIDIIKNNDYIKNLILKLATTSGNEFEKYIDIIHIMCNYYIAVKREEYRLTYDIVNELDLQYTYSDKDVTKEIIRLLLNSNESFKSKVIDELASIGIDKSLSLDIIEFYITKDSQKYNRDDIKKNINKLINISQKLLTSYDLKKFRKMAIIKSEHLKKKYYVSDTKIDIYLIMSKIRLEMIENNLLDNNHIKEYEMLKYIMEKYKLDALPPEVSTLIKKEIYELKCNLDDLSTFISFFSDVYRTEISKLQSQNKSCDNMILTIMNIFKYIDKYSYVSSIYSQILGNEDASLIREDPIPNNSSGITKEERLKKAIEKTFSNFKRKTVSIPTFISDVKTTSDKKITAIVGNFTKPTNLTHGERTGSCMRIGGVAHSLFDSNEIFHIEFDEPLTGKYISRVTGFRNGNTVFLNELRNSCDKSLYSDLDIVEACTNVAHELIRMSKNSTCPIENVVIHRAYAMEEIPNNRVQLNVSDIKEGLSYFYTDVTSYVHVLATTNPPFVPVNLDNSKVPDYLPVRELVRSGNDKLIIEQINRVRTINLALNKKDYRIEPITSIFYGIVGEDFYVYIDENFDIKSEMMTRDERCQIEFEKALQDIYNYIPKKEVRYAI